jgi:hypothetical protein
LAKVPDLVSVDRVAARSRHPREALTAKKRLELGPERPELVKVRLDRTLKKGRRDARVHDVRFFAMLSQVVIEAADVEFGRIWGNTVVVQVVSSVLKFSQGVIVLVNEGSVLFVCCK